MQAHFLDAQAAAQTTESQLLTAEARETANASYRQPRTRDCPAERDVQLIFGRASA